MPQFANHIIWFLPKKWINKGWKFQKKKKMGQKTGGKILYYKRPCMSIIGTVGVLPKLCVLVTGIFTHPKFSTENSSAIIFRTALSFNYRRSHTFPKKSLPLSLLRIIQFPELFQVFFNIYQVFTTSPKTLMWYLNINKTPCKFY